jgi:hypothetical protein
LQYSNQQWSGTRFLLSNTGNLSKRTNLKLLEKFCYINNDVIKGFAYQSPAIQNYLNLNQNPQMQNLGGFVNFGKIKKLIKRSKYLCNITKFF